MVSFSGTLSPRVPLIISIPSWAWDFAVCEYFECYVHIRIPCSLMRSRVSVAFDDERISTSRDSRRRIEIFERLQNHTQPGIFKPKVIYDGDAIAYSSTILSFGNRATVSR